MDSKRKGMKFCDQQPCARQLAGLAHHKHRPLLGMMRGMAPEFFRRLIALNLEAPIQFELDDKIVTIRIEDLPDADRRHHR